MIRGKFNKPFLKRRKKSYLIFNMTFGLAIAMLKCPVVKADSINDDIQGMIYEDSSLVLKPSVLSATSFEPTATTVNSGTFGTCNWDIDADGKLTIHAGTLGVGQGNWIDNQASIKSVYVEPDVIAVSDSSNLFAQLTKATVIDVSNLNTSNVKSFAGMFSFKGKATTISPETSALTKIIGLNNFDTRNAITMASMFANAYRLETLDVSSFDTSHVINFGSMFAMNTIAKGILTEIKGIEGFETQNATNFKSMFLYNDKITNLDVSNFNTGNATDMSDMFSNMPSLTSLDVSNFNTAKVTDMSNMFNGDAKIDNLNVSNFKTGAVTSMVNMFNKCLANIDGLKEFKTDQVTDMTRMLSGTSITNTDDVSGWNIAKVTNLGSMFFDCPNLVSVNLPNWNTSNVISFASLFSSDKALTEIKGLEKWNTSQVTDMGQMFYMVKTESLPEIEDWDTSNVTKMNSLFSYCNKLTSLDISKWDTSKVTDMSKMFNHTDLLTTDGLKGLTDLKTSNVTDMSGMFTQTGVEVLDLSKFDTSKVTNMSTMFSFNSMHLKKIIGKFDTSKVTNMNQMFYGSSSSNASTIDDFSEFNIDKWDTGKVTNFQSMFSNTEYTNLDITKNWNMTAGSDLKSMFSNCRNLQSIDLSNWITRQSAEVTGMFLNTNNLWKIKLGSGSILGEGTNLLSPKAGTAINDPTYPEQTTAISNKWQEVDEEANGTDHQPVGELFTTSEMLDLYREGNQKDRTFVWQQQIYKKVSLEVPDIDFGSFNACTGIIKRASQDNQVIINKYTYPSTSVNSILSVSMDTPLMTADGENTLQSGLIYRDDNNNDISLSNGPAEVYDGQIENDAKNITWDKDHGILLNFTDKAPKNGTYQTTLTWTLTDSDMGA